MEAMRQRLGLEKWALFGGSWGATLALIYAQTHPERVSHLILRGVFTMTQNELAWFYGGGASQFWPDAWEKFIEKIPEDERDDLIAAFHRRLVQDSWDARSGRSAFGKKFGRAKGRRVQSQER